jgi:hypothetical protein
VSEDWGRATGIVAGVKPWLEDSVRLIITISDEGPWCGDPVTGNDSSSIAYASSLAVDDDVVVSFVAATGSSSEVLSAGGQLAQSTGGQVFQSSVPSEDLADALEEMVASACARSTDCDGDLVPDECELSAGTGCEADCNGNGQHDTCDLGSGISLDENGGGVPDECEVGRLLLGRTDLLWDEVPGAAGYDVVRGDLGVLQSTGGDFALATESCLIDDLSSTQWPSAANPGQPGEGFWYLMRVVSPGGPFTYDELSPTQVAPRDPGIAASGSAYP